MRIKYLFVSILFFLLLDVSLFSQENLPVIMYVNATAGLRVRSAPSLDSSVVRTLRHGEFFYITERSNNTVTIDGRTDYWYQVRNGWVFGGYLSNQLPNDLPSFIGKWNLVNQSGEMTGHFILLDVNNNYTEGQEETCGVWGGTYRMNGNTAIITISGHDRETGEPYTMKDHLQYRIQIVDKNNIIIHQNNEQTRYRRGTWYW
ncbi:MAG: SH3 domain-containing protein [Treponema sp.]|nr:SH3 domain-containing protein [Treponema sp.]